MHAHSNLSRSSACRKQDISGFLKDHFNASSGGTATVSLVFGCISLVAWLIPAIGLVVAITSLISGKLGLNTIHNEKARQGIKFAAIGLMLTITNSLAGVILGVLGSIG